MNKAKRIIVPVVYTISLLLIVGSIFMLLRGISNYLEEPINYDHSVRNVFQNTVPVQATKNLIIRPYLSEEVSIGKYFYDYEGEKTDQEKALVYYENTYMQNSGVDYISNNVFDVVSILDGEVISVEEDKVLGKIVQVKHDKDLINLFPNLDLIHYK